MIEVEFDNLVKAMQTWDGKCSFPHGYALDKYTMMQFASQPTLNADS